MTISSTMRAVSAPVTSPRLMAAFLSTGILTTGLGKAG